MIEASPDVPAAEVIIGCMRLHWPDAYFQDADREDFHPIDSPEVRPRFGACREFFAFKDRGAAEGWGRDGATPENANTMLHFLIGDCPRSADSPRQVTMVYDEASEAIRALAADLASRLAPGDLVR